MKHLLCLLLLLIGPMGRAQSIFQGLPLDSASGKIAYQGVIQVAGASKAELYARAREWAATTFKSAKDVLQMDDKDTGILIAKGCYIQHYYIIATAFTNYYWYTVKVEAKDGRFRYTITDFYIEGTAKMMGTGPQMEGQITTSSRGLNSGIKSGNPRGMYKLHIDGVRIPGETTAASIQSAMSKPSSKDF